VVFVGKEKKKRVAAEPSGVRKRRVPFVYERKVRIYSAEGKGNEAGRRGGGS